MAASLLTCASSTPTLEQLKNALLQEMYYLRNNGGRKYKVTNGVRISDNKNGYPYCFELEAELNLADDSPVTLTIGAYSGWCVSMLLAGAPGETLTTVVFWAALATIWL